MKRYLRWHGRMNRKLYALCYLITLILLILVVLSVPYIPYVSYLTVIPAVALVYIKTMCSIQRLHDLNIPGSCVLIFPAISLFSSTVTDLRHFAVLASLVYIGFLLFRKGTEGPNKYGLDPLNIELKPEDDILEI